MRPVVSNLTMEQAALYQGEKATRAGLHMCVKCGREFRSTRRASVCDGCRVPRTPTVRRADLPGKPLTRRERQVADLVSRGLETGEIADALCLWKSVV